jgi:NAD(P)H-hydrate epimerase
MEASMRLVTGREMQAIDHATIDGGHVPSLELMERAGRAAADVALDLLRSDSGRVEIVCGKGNNGGDGLVVARCLAEHGAPVRVWLTHPPDALSPAARAQHQKIAGGGVTIDVLPANLTDPGPLDDPRRRPGGSGPRRTAIASSLLGAPRATSPSDSADWCEALGSAALCIDAVLGTGVREALQPRLAAVVDTLAHRSRRTLALDLPSGIDADTGAICGAAVWADVTVTFGLPKLGLALHPGRERAGRIEVAEIGFPDAIVEANAPQRFWVEREQARALVPRLEPTAHKYGRGTVLVVAGSREFPGAAALTAQAVLRAGAGLVHLVVPASLRAAMQAKLTEVIVHGAAETADGAMARTTEPWLKQILDRCDAWAVGPGIGTAPPTQAWVRDLLRQIELPAVVDADAIPLLPPAHHYGPRVVTPHAGELWRWTGVPVATTGERLATAVRTAKERGLVVLAKGAPTFVATPDDRLFVNASGHAGLATAGSGDVLTGVIAALLAQGLAPADAGVLGAWLHGRAAERVSEPSSPRSLIAGDLLAGLGLAYRDLESA